MKRSYNYKDLTGLVHFALTCMGDSEKRTPDRAVLWIWKCECGNVILRRKNYINKLKTCGNACPLSKEARSNAMRGIVRPFKTPRGLTGLKRMRETYVRRCKKKGIKWAITLKEFQVITSRHCYYCGVEPVAVYRHAMKGCSERAIVHGEYPYNTIDRIDPSIGYILSNCRSACRQCNIMKWNYTDQEFLEQVRRLYFAYVKRFGVLRTA